MQGPRDSTFEVPVRSRFHPILTNNGPRRHPGTSYIQYLTMDILGTQLTLGFPFGLLRLLRSFHLGKLESQLQPSFV